MSRLTRRNVVTGAAVAAAAACVASAPFQTGWAADTITLKCATNLPGSHPLNIRLNEAAERIRRETNGTVRLRIFPDNQFGGDSDMLELLHAGGIDIFTPSALVLSPLVPQAQINAVGFAFSNSDQVWAAMDGDLGKFIRAAVHKAGLHMFEKVCDNGFRQCTTSTRPIVRPEDFAGLKIRVPVSYISIGLFKALSADPNGLQYAELYAALEAKRFEAQENPLSIISDSGFDRVQKYVSLTNHIWDGFFLICNGKTWSFLPGDVRAIISRAFHDAALRQRADIARANAQAFDALKAKGMIFNETELEPFRQAVRKAGFYDEWKKRLGATAWTTLEKYTGNLI